MDTRRGLSLAHTVRPGEYVEARTEEGYAFIRVARNDDGRLFDDGGSEIPLAEGPQETIKPAYRRCVVSDSPDTPVRHDVPEWDEFFLGAAKALTARAKCRRRSVAAVIVDRRHRQIGSGYNGAPSGMPDCLEGACPRGLRTTDEVVADLGYDVPGSLGFCTALHAEENALENAVADVRAATCYVSEKPCPSCTRKLAGAGIARVVWPAGEGVPQSMLDEMAGVQAWMRGIQTKAV